jgi:large-conductance mechanosensitive channel
MKILSDIDLFLKKKDLIYMALSVYIGLVLQKLLESLIADIIIPLFNATLPKKIKEMNLNILDLNINNFMTHVVSSFLAIGVTYLFMKLIIR